MSVRNYAILYGGVRRVSGGGSVGGGNALLTTDQHALDGPEHTGQLPETRISTTETDTTLVLRPDGTGGVEFGADAGGADAPFDHGAMGATETIDLADGTWHRGTLSADCAITVQGFSVDEGVVAIFEVTQNATGGFGITWDADVDFGTADDQPDQTALATTIFLLMSSVGDSQLYGFKVGVGGSSVGALDDLTDVTLTAPTADDQLQYVGGEWVNNSRRWEPVTTNPGTGPEFVWDGDDIVMTWRTY